MQQRLAKEAIENLPEALGLAVKALKAGDGKALRAAVFSPSMLLSSSATFARGGARSLKNFIKGSTNARYNQLLIVGAVAYLEWESACGKALDQLSGEYPDTTPEGKVIATEALENLECGGKGLTGRKNRKRLYQLYGNIFADTLTGEYDEEAISSGDFSYNLSGFGHGALFHMMKVAEYQLKYRLGGPPIKDIEGSRHIWLYSNSTSLIDHKDESNPDATKSDLQGKYQRYVDIILGEPDGTPEAWVELKSYSAISKAKGTYLNVLYDPKTKTKGTISPWILAASGKNEAKTKGQNLHRQFSLDRAAAHVRHARVYDEKTKLYPPADVSTDFIWYFQKFDIEWKTSTGAKQSAISVDLGKENIKTSVMGGLSLPISNHNGTQKEVYQANFGNGISGNNRIKEANIANSIIEDLKKLGFGDTLEFLAP